MKLLPLYCGPRPTDIPEAFGYRAPYWCENCGFTSEEPETVVHSRATAVDDEDSSQVCPDCHGEIYDAAHIPIKAINRRTVTRLSV